MHSDLVVMTFDCEGEAHRVREALQATRRSSLLAPENAAIVTKDRAGRAKLDHEWEMGDGWQGNDLNLLNKIARMTCNLPPEKVLHALAKAGLETRFLENIAGALGNDSSALLFLVRPDGVPDADELLGALALFKGKLHRTTLSPQVEAFVISTR